MSGITEFLKNFDYSGWVNNIKLIFLVLTIFFLAVAIYAMIKAHGLLKHAQHKGGHGHAASPKHANVPGHEPQAENEDHGEESGHGVTADHSTKWEQIKARAESVREAEWKLSVVEADNLVDSVLKERGYPGETMGERLMLIHPDQLSSLQDLWDAHKLRNLLVHDAGYKVSHEQVLAAMHAFDKVLRELGAIA